MTTPFPGMDPYLERRSLWEEVHVQLITALARELNPLVRPRYRIGVEKRTYLTVNEKSNPSGKPDVLVVTGPSPSVSQATAIVHRTTGSNGTPLIAELPIPEEIIERYLEVRDVETQEVVTTIEILSRANKSDKRGRRAYLKKRHQVLQSLTHLVEIDLLRAGKAMELHIDPETLKDYHIVVSRSEQRPLAEVYCCTIREPIPRFPLPLRPDDIELMIDLNHILHELYEVLNFDLAIDYTQVADPPIASKDVKWVDQRLRQHQLR